MWYPVINKNVWPISSSVASMIRYYPAIPNPYALNALPLIS